LRLIGADPKFSKTIEIGLPMDENPKQKVEFSWL
jgi:hypothetical protein